MARRFSEFLLVGFGEVLDIAEADLAGDLRDRLAGGQQHFTGQLQAEKPDKEGRGFPGQRLELVVERGAADPDRPAQFRNAEMLVAQVFDQRLAHLQDEGVFHSL